MAVIEELAADETSENTTIEDEVKKMTVDEKEPVNDESAHSTDTGVDEAPAEPEDPAWTNVRDLLQSDDVEEVVKGMNVMLEESDEATMLLNEYYWDVVPAVVQSVGSDEKSGNVSLLAKKVLHRVELSSPAKEVPIAVFSHLATCKTAQQTTILLKTAAVATSRVEAAKIRYNLIGDFAEQCEKIFRLGDTPYDPVDLALAVVKPLLPTAAKEADGDLNSEALQAMSRLMWICLKALDKEACDSLNVNEEQPTDYQPSRTVTELVYILSDTPGLGIQFLLKHSRRAAYQFWKEAKDAELLPMSLEECASYGDYKWSLAGLGHFALVLVLEDRFPVPFSPIYRVRLLLPGAAGLLQKGRSIKSANMGLRLLSESTLTLPTRYLGGAKAPILLEYRNWGIRLKQKEKVAYQNKRPGWLQSMPDANDIVYHGLMSLSVCPNEDLVKSVMASIKQVIACVSTRGRVQLLMKNLENIKIPSVTAGLWDILRENMVEARKGLKKKREKKGDGDGKKKRIPFLGTEVCTFLTTKTNTMISQATPNKPEGLIEQVDNLAAIVSIWKFMIQSSKPIPPGTSENDERHLLDDPWKVRDRAVVSSLQLGVEKLIDNLEYTNNKDPRLGLLLHNCRELRDITRPLIEALFISGMNRH